MDANACTLKNAHHAYLDFIMITLEVALTALIPYYQMKMAIAEIAKKGFISIYWIIDVYNVLMDVLVHLILNVITAFRATFP